MVVADAKYGSAGLDSLKDGTRQMSPKWVRERLEDAVGLREARKINRQGYEPTILKIDKDGNVSKRPLNDYTWRKEDL